MLLRLGLVGSLLAAHAQAEDAAPDRQVPRVRAGAAFTLAGGYASGMMSAGAGLSADLGVVLLDRVSVLARGWYATVFLSGVASVSVGAEYAFSDLLSAGVGVALVWHGGVASPVQPLSSSVALPLRLNVALSRRGESDRWRRGLYLTFEVAPGYRWRVVTFLDLRAAPEPFSIAASASIGYALF